MSRNERTEMHESPHGTEHLGKRKKNYDEMKEPTTVSLIMMMV